ncbi:MAG TPA: VWA domain-containing protein [Minicystis sp.]|nr:VWA domain-containing protein [Minicystis sp.]
MRAASSLLSGLGFVALAALAGCSASGSSNSSGGFGGGSTESGGGASRASGDTGTFVGSGGGLQSGTGTMGVGGGCAGTKSKAEQRPLDMYIMLDQSASMSEQVAGNQTKWQAVTSALDGFVQAPTSAGIGVGLGYFGVPASGGGQCPTTCHSNSDCGPGCGPCALHFCVGGSSGGDSCDAADYAVPAVEIGTLPGAANAQSTAIVNSISMHMPYSNTPTAPALQGAIDHAQQWASTHPNDVVVAVLATDGEPTECSPQDIGSIAQIAAAAFAGTPKIVTFVIGVGSSTANLNAIAMSGGSGQAFLVDTSQDVNQQFTAALNAIRGTALGCSYAIPAPSGNQMLDFNKVNVEYTPGGGGSPETIPKVSGAAACPPNGDGWYYDDAAAPTMIVMCPSTCAKLSMDMGGELDIVLGCDSIVN